MPSRYAKTIDSGNSITDASAVTEAAGPKTLRSVGNIYSRRKQATQAYRFKTDFSDWCYRLRYRKLCIVGPPSGILVFEEKAMQ